MGSFEGAIKASLVTICYNMKVLKQLMTKIKSKMATNKDQSQAKPRTCSLPNILGEGNQDENEVEEKRRASEGSHPSNTSAAAARATQDNRSSYIQRRSTRSNSMPPKDTDLVREVACDDGSKLRNSLTKSTPDLLPETNINQKAANNVLASENTLDSNLTLRDRSDSSYTPQEYESER